MAGFSAPSSGDAGGPNATRPEAGRSGDLSKVSAVGPSQFPTSNNVTFQAERVDARRIVLVDNPLLILFRDDLSAKFAADPLLNNPQAKRFLEETTQLFGLLRDLARYPKSADNEDERVYAYSKLMNFLGKLQRHDQYVKYAHDLSREMVQLGFYSEGAMALLLHARLLGCDTPSGDGPLAATADDGAAAKSSTLTATDPERLLPDSVSVKELISGMVGVSVDCHGDCLGPHGQGAAAANAMLDELPLGSEHFPRQSALARREVLYMRAIDLFEKGQQWEPALELAEALKRQFGSVAFDFDKRSALLRRCAGWYDSILSSERYYPSVFRVAYYGKKFPPELANQEFVYRGAPLEQIIDFSSRIKHKFPGVQLLDLKTVPGPEHTDQADKYFMAISKLAPSSRPEMRGLPSAAHVSNPLLPPMAAAYRKNNVLDTFSYRRPYNKRKMSGLKKSANSTVYFASTKTKKELDTDGEFRDLWVEFKYVRTERLFPSTQRRVLVAEHSSVFRNPIEMAVESMEDKNAELEVKIATMETLPDGGE